MLAMDFQASSEFLLDIVLKMTLFLIIRGRLVVEEMYSLSTNHRLDSLCRNH